MSKPPFTPLVAGLPPTVPFVGPEHLERERGRPFRARLGANENVFGPSPRAVEAMRAAAGDVWKYADPDSFELRGALCAHLGAPPENIAIGEGIDGLLELTVRMFIEPGDTVVSSAGAYPTFSYHVAGHGGRQVTVPYRDDDREDPAALAEAAHAHGAKLVYLANPNNPMGSWLTASEVRELINALPAGALLCLDEAYIECAPAEAAPPLDVADSRVIRFRTMSKAYALAGMRCGYAIAHADIAAAFEKIRNHFGMTPLTHAAALAALADQAHLRDVVGRIDTARRRVSAIAADNGLTALPSATNFVAIDCGRDGDFARRVLNELAARDIFVRMPGLPPQNRCIRVSVGSDAELALFAEMLPQALAAAD